MKVYRPLAAAAVSLVVCISTFAQKVVFQGKVTDTLDGSTVVVETKSKSDFVVKCQATTAPLGEPYAEYSRQRLASLVLGQMVTVEYTERDQEGHILGTIFLNREDVCLSQISAGLARFDPQAPATLNTSRRELYAVNEEYARSRGTGVWTTPDKPAVSSVLAPNKRTAPDNRFDNNWSRVGNVSPYTSKPGTKSWFARNWWVFPTVGALVGAGFLLHRYGGGSIPCNDGTFSNAQNRQGACSHHGGIRR